MRSCKLKTKKVKIGYRPGNTFFDFLRQKKLLETEHIFPLADWRALSLFLDLFMPETTGYMVVHHSSRLHVRITGG